MVFLQHIPKILPLLLILAAVSKANDVAWYQSFLSEQVAPSYVAAYRTLKDKIINPLLVINTEESTSNAENVAAIVSLAQGLTCAAKELYVSLSVALNASEQLNQDVEKKLLELISSVSQKENEVRQANDQLRAIEARLTDAQSKVNEAENDVRNKENELAQADAQLAEEQRKVDEARLCGLRKKRFIGSIFRPIKNILRPIIKPFKPIVKPILRPICAVINYEGINRAKDRRGAAQGAVNAARERLAARRQELERLRAEYTNLQNQQSQATGQLRSFYDTLAQLQARQAALAKMTQDMRNVVKHLATFVSKSSILYDELQDLVSFELLIEPLNAILTELINNGLATQTMIGITQISAAEINSLEDTIALLKAKLPTLPLNEGASYSC